MLDVQLTRLAEFYGNSNALQRGVLRSALNPAASWSLVAYVRRMAIQILETKDSHWLVSALNIASLENTAYDYRDSIVSLVIARAAAESVSIDAMPYFAEATAAVMLPWFRRLPMLVIIGQAMFVTYFVSLVHRNSSRSVSEVLAGCLTYGQTLNERNE